MKTKSIIIILDNIRSRENVGSIFRTADGAGVDKIYLCGITPTPKMNNELRIMNNEKRPKNRNSKFTIHNSEILLTDKISKTALGAEKWVPWEYRKQAWRLLLELKNQKSKCKIVGLEQTKNSKNIFELRSQVLSSKF
ncbi:MAG: hypothetical protein A2918_03550 [Candidatus Yanofskybacteria bacterium RIFCSPLOWO2_01_FULL_42_49]|uniref:tRNA/rRNA methyltransferase SpoU type domain-containing protein n=1 Tax=Candidatus Yanofskybacteria bacterium RIFCSPLOWO2_01_FULL_42_49 TaxID=1802694 RepID=A0A1F8GCF7_9BACT|nr:MAG: hypothetical protein A2918_03550 [Candidatus Yanofskybacteria bacterium RIFCSPLOWO2_01_FULL_42_49]